MPSEVGNKLDLELGEVEAVRAALRSPEARRMGFGDLYVRRRSRDPSFIQLHPVPAPAGRRGSRASPGAGQTLTLPQLQRSSPSPLVPAAGWPLTPAGSAAQTGAGLDRRTETLPCPKKLTQAETAGLQSLFLYFVWLQVWACALHPKGS